MRRGGAAGRGGIDAHAALRRLEGQAGRERVHAALGRAVGHAVDAARGDGGDVDDGTTALLQHERQRRVAAPQRGEQRAAHLGLDLVLAVVLKRLGPDGAADVVDQHVQAAKAQHGLGHHALALGVALQVGREREHTFGGAGQLAQFVHQLRAVHSHHAGALFQQPFDDAPAYALRRSGDDRHLVLETGIHG